MPSGSSRSNEGVLLAGWVFADLLLGMMVIFLIAAPGGPPLPPPSAADSAEGRRTATAAVEQTAAAVAVEQTATAERVAEASAASATARSLAAVTVVPTLTATPIQLAVLETTSVDFDFRIGGSSADLDAQILEQLSQYRDDGRRAGFVMVFTVDSNRSQAVIDRLVALLPEIFDRGAVLRPYLDLSLRNSESGQRTANVEVFFFDD